MSLKNEKDITNEVKNRKGVSAIVVCVFAQLCCSHARVLFEEKGVTQLTVASCH